MKRILFALAAIAATFGAATEASAQASQMRVIGRAPDGVDRPVLVTQDGKLQVSNDGGNTVVTARSTAYGSSLLVKSGPGRLFSFTAYATATGWVLPFDALTCPADGAVAPLLPTIAYVAANSTLSVDFGIAPLSFTTGLVLCYSTTGPFTKTASTTAVFSAQVQ